MQEKNVLIPHNFTEEDEKALDYATRIFAHQPRTTITLYHLYTPLPRTDKLEPGTKDARTNTAVLIKQNIWDKENELQTLANKLTASGGFTPEQIKIKLKARRKSVGKELLEAVEQGGYNSIVVSADPSKSPRRLFGENVYDTLLSHLKETEIIIVA
jgi:nucleotide-binding universal stress UspA family protein